MHITASSLLTGATQCYLVLLSHQLEVNICKESVHFTSGRKTLTAIIINSNQCIELIPFASYYLASLYKDKDVKLLSDNTKITKI